MWGGLWHLHFSPSYFAIQVAFGFDSQWSSSADGNGEPKDPPKLTLIDDVI